MGNEYFQKAFDLFMELRGLKESLGRSEQGRLVAIACTDAEKLSAFIGHYQSAFVAPEE